jgi:signal transduction histidine kinase/CheY-like chemotaxis protein/HPt (histidine-containing phosphotransfer) domain-containing protein
MLAAIIIAYSAFIFIDFTGSLLNDRIVVTAKSVKTHFDDCMHATRTAAAMSAANIDVKKAIRERDTSEIIRLLSPTLEIYSVNYYTICDNEGIVLARTYDSSNVGDSILNQQNVKDALSGIVNTYIEPGNEVKVSIRSGAPVYDTDGTLIGLISAGMRLDLDETVDDLKERFSAEFSVFYGDTIAATTIMNGGERITGTSLDPEIAKTVIGGKREYFSNDKIFGKKYNAFYMPLLNPQGEAFAVFFIGILNTELSAKTTDLIIGNTLVGLTGLVISIFAMLWIIGEIIKPINRLVNLVSEVSQGNFEIILDESDITHDELGALTVDVHSLLDIIRTLLGDLSLLTHEFILQGDIRHRMTPEKYSGSYQQIATGINLLIDSVSEMNKTMNIMDQINIMICITDLDYNLLYLNSSMAKAFGLDKETCVNQKCYSVTRHKGKPCPFCQLPALLPDKDSFPSLDIKELWDDDLQIWLGGKASIIRWVDGSPAYLYAVSNETAENYYKTQLREAVQIAESASNAKSSFLANMSHEMRTPLNVVVGLTDLWMENEKLSGKMRDDLKKINTAGEILLGIVNDVLDISKIEAGKFELSPAEYELASTLNDIITLNMIRIESKPINFIVDINQDLPQYLCGDELRIKQIFNNLLSNAFKYTKEGTVSLSVICSREDEKNCRMEIIVSDTGIGIRKEDLQKLFDDYIQVDAKARGKTEGTGLGLAITKSFVEMMDGKIDVESEYGKGTTFRVNIRQGLETEKTIGPETVDNLVNFRYINSKQDAYKKLARPDLGYARVLVVDDFPTNLDVAAGMMRKYNLEVDCVKSGQEAVDRIGGGKPVYDAVFMDHMMPGMDGMEATSLIRNMDTEYARTVPIIALTANALAGSERMFLDKGFNAFLSKPINVLKLDLIIQKWVRDETREKNLWTEEKNAESPDLPDESEAEEEEIKIPGIETENGLALFDGNTEIYLLALQSYVNNTPAVLDKLRTVNKESLSEYTINVHGIKGVSANIGAEKLKIMAAGLEAMAKAGDVQGLSVWNEPFLEYADNLIETIRDWLKEHKEI